MSLRPFTGVVVPHAVWGRCNLLLRHWIKTTQSNLYVTMITVYVEHYIKMPTLMHIKLHLIVACDCSYITLHLHHYLFSWWHMHKGFQIVVNIGKQSRLPYGVFCSWKKWRWYVLPFTASCTWPAVAVCNIPELACCNTMHANTPNQINVLISISGALAGLNAFKVKEIRKLPKWFDNLVSIML